MKNKITMNIGISLFLCVFLILSFVVFAVLSLVTAQKHWETTQKSVKHTEAYYALSELGERRLESIEEILRTCYEEAEGKEAYEAAAREALKALPDSVWEGQDFTFTVEDGEQELYVSLEIRYPGTALYELTAWKVRPTETWEPDTGMDIW